MRGQKKKIQEAQKQIKQQRNLRELRLIKKRKENLEKKKSLPTDVLVMVKLSDEAKKNKSIRLAECAKVLSTKKEKYTVDDMHLVCGESRFAVKQWQIGRMIDRVEFYRV